VVGQQLVNGLFLGAVYALFAIGYTLIFGVLDILNLAHAAIFMLAAFAAWSLLGAGLPFWLAAPIAIAGAGILGIVLDRIAFAPLRRRAAPNLIPLISSIGMAIIFGAIARGIYGPDERPFTLDFLQAPPLHAGPLTFTIVQIVILGSAIAFMLGLAWVMRATALGRAIRAVAEDRIAAALLGIDLERTIAATFFIASALGGLAGILTALQYNSVQVDMGGQIELKGLAVIVLGGMGSITGAVIGGFVIGMVETLAVAVGLSEWRDAISYGVMFLILILRPTGLFGKRTLRTA
jgi:branched-chain amino acid transport system permease protein